MLKVVYKKQAENELVRDFKATQTKLKKALDDIMKRKGIMNRAMGQ